MRRVFLIRHGETEWSLSGQHTGTTDIPLTERGRTAARLLAPLLSTVTFDLVLTSPLGRARQTCELAGLSEHAEIEPDLKEWNYGEYEGLTPHEIRERNPGWMIFTDGCPGGESPEQVGARIDRVIAKVRRVNQAALFAHGHVFRVLVARWLGLGPQLGSSFLLDTATVSVLGYYRDVPAVKRWNAPLATEFLQLASRTGSSAATSHHETERAMRVPAKPRLSVRTDGRRAQGKKRSSR